jgi:hypothetical protein
MVFRAFWDVVVFRGAFSDFVDFRGVRAAWERLSRIRREDAMMIENLQ